MSTSSTFTDEQAFIDAISSVRADSSDVNFVLIGHVNGDPLKLEVLGTGGDPNELCMMLKEDQVQYGLARYTSKFDMSNTVKFAYIRWVGDKVAFAKKGRYGVVSGSIQQRFNPYHIFIESSSTDDFLTENVLKKLEENSGTASKVIDNSIAVGRQERGFTQNQLPKRGPQAVSGPTVSKMGSVIQVSPEVAEAIKSVRSDHDPVQWMIAEYQTGSSSGPIIHSISGTSDSEEMTDNFTDDKVMYALYRTSDRVDDIDTVKFVFIQWVGPNVRPMIKAKISTHKGVIDETFAPYHVKIFATDRSDISESIIREKVSSASGTKVNVK